MHGVKLYTFKHVNDVKWKLSEKLLQHFYSLWDIIFGAISESSPSAEISLFYNEEFDGKVIVVTVKFANDIDSNEFLSCHKMVVDAFEVLFAKDLFVGEIFSIFFARPMMKDKCVFGIPKRMSSLNERMTLITLWSNSINFVFFFLESKTISCM